MSEEVIEVKPEVIDAPTRRTAIDGLVERAVRLEDAIKRGDTYSPHEITSHEDYKQSNNERKELRKDIKAITDERASLFRRVEEQKRRIHDALVPADEAQKEYKRRMDEWERTCVDSRTQEVRAWYEETQGDVARLVPFDVLWRRYAADGKWDRYSTNLVSEEEDVARRVEGIERDLDTIRGYGFEPQDEANVQAAYLRTLDLSAAVREAEEARRQRERMAEVERRRAERMAEEAKAAPAPVQNVPLPLGGVPARGTEAAPAATGATPATERPDAPQAPAREAHEAPVAGTVAYVVTVPRERVHDFAEAMRALGWAHGRRLTDEQRREWESWQRA